MMEQNSNPNQNQQRPYQRKIIIVKRLLQMKVVSLVFLTALFTALIVLLDLFYIFGKLLSKELEERLIAALFADVSVLLVLHLPVFLLLVVLVSIFISHRFAGPIFRLEKIAEAVGNGDLTVRAHLRRGDELAQTAEQMNQMIEALQERILEEKNLSERVKERLERIIRKIKNGQGSSQELVEELKELQMEVAHITSNFKLQ